MTNAVCLHWSVYSLLMNSETCRITLGIISLVAVFTELRQKVKKKLNHYKLWMQLQIAAQVHAAFSTRCLNTPLLYVYLMEDKNGHEWSHKALGWPWKWHDLSTSSQYLIWVHICLCFLGSICWSPATVGVMAVGICTTLLLILSLFLGIKHLNKKKRTQTVNEGKRKLFPPCLHLSSVALRTVMIFMQMLSKLVCKTCAA